jgi:hypothetical protein
MALPARELTMSAENTGASSRASARPTTAPVWFSAPNCRNPSTSWRPNTIPTNVPVRPTMKIDCTPTNSIASMKRRTRYGGRIPQKHASKNRRAR